MSFRRFHRLPDVVSGAPLNHFVGIIIPLARTNLITNGSFETNTTGWAAGTSTSIARSAAQQYHGVYSLAATYGAIAGACRYDISLTAGTTYAFSTKFIEPTAVGRTFKISIASNIGVDLVAYTFRVTGRWQWLWILYTAASTATHQLRVDLVTVPTTGIFYLDGAQLEAITDGILRPTTYIDGDQPGLLVGQQPPAYVWNGTPHASTSTRSALTRAGGYIMDIRTAYGFLLTGLFGLGLATPNNVSIPYTVLDGARFQRVTKPPRTISLAGRFQATTRTQLDRLRSDMRAAVDRDLVPVQQPLVLHVEPRDDCGAVSGDFAQIQCLYAGGLEGSDTSALAEDVAPAFTMYVPFLLGGSGGATLSVQQTVTNANRILQRGATGLWSALSTGASTNDVLCLARGLDGKIYIGGRFGNLGGLANTAGIGYWDPSDSAFHAMGTGVSTGTVSVTALAVAPNGDVVAGGDFSTMGGVANTLRLARWSGSAWSALSTGVNGQVRALAFDRVGLLYLGGSFTNAGGVAAADSVASWNGSAFAALGTGSVAAVNALAVDSANNLFAGGLFTSMGGVTGADIVAKWNGTAWSAMGGSWAGGGPTQANALAVGANNLVYAGGDFTTAGGVAANRIAVWNGTSWAPMGTGMNLTVYSIARRADGAIVAGGAFTTVNGITVPDGIAVWNGSTWTFADADLPGTATVFSLLPVIDGTLYAGYDTAGSATTAALTSVTNSTPGIVYPTLTINGPSSGTSRIYQIVNYTTGVGVWLNLTLSAGEVATLRFDPQNPSYTTTFQGDITSTILPGSAPSLMYLAPGANSVSFFAASSTVVAVLSWQKHYSGLNDLVN